MAIENSNENIAIESSQAKESVKRALEDAELANEAKTKLYRDEHGIAQSVGQTKTTSSQEENFGEGEIEVDLVDSKTGDAIDLASLGGTEVFFLVKEEISKLNSKIDSATGCNNFQIANLINEDEKSALIKLLETAQDKFAIELHSRNEATMSPMWITCYAMTKLLFGQILNLTEPITVAQSFIINFSDKFQSSDPSPFMLLSLVHLNEATFAIKSHFESVGSNIVVENSASEAPLPSKVFETLQEVRALTEKFSGFFASAQVAEVDVSVPRHLFVEWIETLCTLVSFNKHLVAEKEFTLAALEILAKALEKLGSVLLLTTTPETLSYINSLLFKIFSIHGSTYPQAVKPILVAGDSISQSFLDSNEGSFDIFSSFGHVSLALSKLMSTSNSTPQDDCTDSIAEFYAKGIECFERALEFKDDASVKAYLNELTIGVTNDENPKYFALYNNEELADEAEDVDFVPDDDEDLEDDEEIVLNPAEEDLSDGVEDADIPLDQIPEVTIEPGQVLVSGTRSAPRDNTLVEEEDEEADPEFVPQVSDVEEELGQSDAEEISGFVENEADDEPSMREEVDAIPVGILSHPDPLVDESEEVDPDFVPLSHEVEEDLAPSDSEEEIQPIAPIGEEEDDEDDNTFVPSDQEDSEDNDDDILDDEEEEISH